MSIRRLMAAMAAALVWLVCLPAAAAPLEAYGKLPSIEVATLSARGDKVAVVVTDGAERRIVVKDLAKDQVLLLATVGQTKVRDLSWAGDDNLILTTSSTQRPLNVQADRSEWYFASLIDIPKKKLMPLLGDVEETMNVLTGVPIVRTVDGRPVVILPGVKFVNSSGVVALFEVGLARGRSKLVEVGQGNTDGFVIGPDGQPLAQSLYDGATGAWTLKVRSGGGWRDLMARNEPIDAPDVLGLGRDGRTVLVVGGEKDEYAWQEVSLDSGKTQLLDTADYSGTIRDRATGKVIGLRSLVGDDITYAFFDPADDRAWKAVAGAFPGDQVALVDWSLDRRRILVRVDSPTLGPLYAVVDLDTRNANWLGAEYKSLEEKDIGSVKPVAFKAADGLALSGYLTLPKGREAKNLPLIVFPHGGPASRDVPGFDWWAQAMASRGYAVLQVNFRGSEGLGRKFQEAGYGQWGRKMQSDLSDGVQTLASQGVIDPKRVCIVGASYGGYAALAGVTLQQGVYRCAVSFGGVADLRRLVAYSRGRSARSTLRYWTRYMGAKDLNDPVLAEVSPAARAADASAPVMLIHGKDDTVVPLEQSQLMADALRRAGKPVELVVQNNSDHWLSLGETRLQMLQSAMAFVEKHNPPN